MFWASFNNAPKRIQNGGWARQVTQADFAIAEKISGVNMRLTAGGIREMHWHLAAEWAFMSYGNCRITVLDELGRAYVSDVKEGDLWYFPPACRIRCRAWDRRLRVHPLLRRRQGERVQHAAADRLARPYAARDSGREFRRSGRQLLQDPAAKPMDLQGSCPAICPSTGRRSQGRMARRRIRSPSRFGRADAGQTDQRVAKCGSPTAATSTSPRRLPRLW